MFCSHRDCLEFPAPNLEVVSRRDQADERGHVENCLNRGIRPGPVGCVCYLDKQDWQLIREGQSRSQFFMYLADWLAKFLALTVASDS